jgi:hypothetical protein
VLRRAEAVGGKPGAVGVVIEPEMPVPAVGLSNPPIEVAGTPACRDDPSLRPARRAEAPDRTGWPWTIEAVLSVEVRGGGYNVAPTKLSAAVLARPPRDEPDADPVRQLRNLKWGL